jgi:hypothetical protein
MERRLIVGHVRECGCVAFELEGARNLGAALLRVNWKSKFCHYL